MKQPLTWAQVQQNNPCTIDIALNASECAELAKDIGILELHNYCAQLRFNAQNDGSLMVRGHLTAQAVQACIATDAPVTTSITHDIKIRYMPPQRFNEVLKRDGGDNAILINSNDDEEREALPPEGITPYALAREELILALPSYPRCPDAP